MLSKPINRLKVLQWNAQGATTESVIAQIDHFLTVEDIDVACVSETYLLEAHDFKLTNYSVYRNDRQSHGGGVLIATRHGIEYKRLPHINTKVAENVSIEVSLDRVPMTLTSAYVPKYTKNYKSDITKMTPSNKNCMVFGDFNAKHSSWNCTSNNRAGKTLYNMINASEFLIHYPETHTHFPHCGSTPSTIDFALTNSPIICSHVYTLEGRLPSDHNPVIFHIEGSYIEKMPDAKPNYRRADWNKFSSLIDNQLRSMSSVVHSKCEIDSLITRFVYTIRNAEAEAIPLETKMNRRRLKISKETINLIKLRNDTRRQWQRCTDSEAKPIYKSQINAQNKAIKKSVSHDFNRKWNKSLQSLNPGDNKLWTLTRKMMNKGGRQIEILVNGSQTITSDEQISESLADQFVKNNSLTVNDVSSADDHVAKVVRIIENLHPISLNTKEHHIDVHAVKKITTKLKVKKAPGLDGIPNIILKHLPDSALTLITEIINSCIDLCYFPAHFKIAKVIPILKTSKDSKCPANYRPISLLSSLGKIFERIINSKLNASLVENSSINPKQFGFREGHSTVHQVKRLLNIINDNKTKRRSTGMVLLDIEKAFDSVWHGGLIYKLHNVGTPPVLVKLLASFLEDRHFTVCVNGKNSTERTVKAGLPQGSVISPVLYAIFTADLKIPSNCDAGYFADDTAIVSAAKQSNTIIKALTNALSSVDNYFKKWKIRVNSNKTQAILFKYNQSKKRSPTRQLIFNGTIIELSHTVKYLGVTLDHKLNFGKHIESCQTKSLNCFKAIYPLLARKSRMSTVNKLILYRTVILPKMTYASPVWSSTAATNLNKLQLIQNKILKCVHGAPKTFPTITLHAISNIAPIKHTINDLTVAFTRKCLDSEYDLIRSLYP